MKNGLKPPKLEIGNYSVLMAELKTGHILKLGGRLLTENDNPFRVFENFQSAKAFCLAEIMRNSLVEFVIYNESREPILSLSSNKSRELKT